MSNNAGIQNARGREKGLEADFLRGERNCHIIRLVILSGGMWVWGRGREGWGGRGLGWQNLAAIHDGGISTKIISPQATEGVGGVVEGCREEKHREVRDCRGRRRRRVGEGEGGYKGGK